MKSLYMKESLVRQCGGEQPFSTSCMDFIFSHLPSVVCLDFVKFLRCLCAPTFSIQDSFDEGFSS